MTHAETTGSVVALADGAAEAGETISIAVTVTNQDTTVSRQVVVTIATNDPYGQAVSGYTSTTLTLASLATGTTATDALRIRVRQDTPCGHRIPVVVRAYLAVNPTGYQTFETQSVLVGKPASSPPSAAQRPLRLDGLTSLAFSGAWKTTTPERFAAVETTTSSAVVGVAIHRSDGTRERSIPLGNWVSGARLVRGDDGWGVAWIESTDVYFMKIPDVGSPTTKLLVDSSGADSDQDPWVGFDSAVGWIVAYTRSTGSNNFYRARRVEHAGTVVSTALDLFSSTSGGLGMGVYDGRSGTDADGDWSYFALYYRGGATAQQVAMLKFYWYEPGSARAPAVQANAVVDDGTGIGENPRFVRVARSSAPNESYHYLAYSYFDGFSQDNIYYRRVYSGPSIDMGTRLQVLAHSGGDGNSVLFDLARRGADDEVSVVYASDQGQGIGVAEIRERRISGLSPTLGALRSLSAPVSYSRLGDFHLGWVAGDRLTLFMAGTTTRGDSFNYFAEQPADVRALVVPTVDAEVKLTEFDGGDVLAMAAAGDRIGVFTFSFAEGGYHLRILGRDGLPAPRLDPSALPKIEVQPVTPPGGNIPRWNIALASDGTDFAVMYEDYPGTGDYRVRRYSGATGLPLGAATSIPRTLPAAADVGVALVWTGARYRFLLAEDNGATYQYHTGTLTAAGSYEAANRLNLGTMPSTNGSFDTSPALACNGGDTCWISYGPTLRSQTSLTSFASRTLSANAIHLASDGSGVVVLRSDGNFERCWAGGTQRPSGVTAIPDWTGDPAEYRRMLADGEGFVLLRVSAYIPALQFVSWTGSAAPGWRTLGTSPLAAWQPLRSVVGNDQSADLAWSASGEAFVAFIGDPDGFGEYDVYFTRGERAEGTLDGCTALANSAPAPSVGGPYSLEIRSGGSPYVLTDGLQGANQATFRVGAAGVADPDFGGRIASAGWDFNGDGVVDRAVGASALADGVVTQAESQVVLTSDELLAFGFPTNTTTCTCPVRFYATDQFGATSYAQASVSMVDKVPPTVTLTTPNGGEAWPGGSAQDVAWDAVDNVATGGFDLAFVTEKSYLPNVTLPRVLTEGTFNDFFFDVPAPCDPVVDVNFDIDVRWPGIEPYCTVDLTNMTTSTIVTVADASGPALSITALVGNFDRTLASNQAMGVFDGAPCGTQWRIGILPPANGNPATLHSLRLNVVTARTPIVASLPGSQRSYSWPLPTTVSPATRVEITARDVATPANSARDDSDRNFYITQPNSDQVKTLVVWNETRTRARYPTAQVDELEAKLLDLVAHVKIDGALIDLSSGEANAAGIGALYAAWDATAWNDSVSTDNATNVTAANALASAIRTFLYGKVSTLYPNLEAMILVGGDVLVPFFREVDTTPLKPESDYPTEIGSMSCVATRSPTLAAVCANTYLSDGRYGASSAKPVPGSPLSWWLPDVAVGRLVESPEQVTGLVATYIAQDGVTVVDEIATTGYDFLTDGGDACYTALQLGLEPGSQNISRLSEAVSAWTDTQLKDRLFGLSGTAASDLSFVSGHANHVAEGAAAAGGAGALTTTEMNTGTAAVPGAVLVGLGCHAGLSVLPDGGPSDPTASTFQLDLAELFATKRFPAYIGNTGYGWGFTDGIGLGEKLIGLVAAEVLAAGQVSLGEALRLAKQEYFLRQDRVDGYDHKVIHESTLYGIPNYEVRVTKATGLVDAVGSWYGAGSRSEVAATRAKSARQPGAPWLGDPSWETKTWRGGELSRSPVIEVSAAGEAPNGVSLRVMDFSYQAFATSPPAWQGSHAYDRMTVVRPTTANGHVYAATKSGTSGALQPAWPTGAGATIADGSVIWTEYSSAWPNAYVRHDVCRDTTSGESEPCANVDGSPGAGQTKVGVYLTLDGMATGEGGSAIQPMISFDSHLSGTKLHGIMVRGGEYEEPRELNPAACLNEFGQTIRCFDPVVGNPQTKDASPEGPAPAPFVMYSKPTPFVMYSKPTPHGFDESNGYTNSDPLRWDNLNAPMGEMVRRGRTPDQLREIHTEWLYRTRDFSQFYSESSDWAAPTFGGYTGECNPEEPGLDCYSLLLGLTAAIAVPVADAGDGVYRVYVTWSSDVDSSGRGAWRTLELTDAGGGVWTGTLELRRTTHYLVQAVDWAGNVATVDVTGSDVAGNGSPMGSSFTLPRLWTIEVPDSDGDGLPDAWEAMHPCVAGGTDPDDDLLSNLSEFDLGLDPCNGDSDGGGDNDGSEQNHGRSPFGGSDDLEITIGVSKVGSTWTVDWGDGRGANVQIDGKYHVYRNSTPFFGPGHRAVGPLSDATKSWADASPSCDPVCYYRVWNVALALPPPTVTVVSPPSGPAVGNTVVNVYGSDFVEGAAVFFRGVAATSVVVHNGSWISCRTPANATGLCDVKVVNPNGQEGVLAGGFSYTP